MNSATPSDNVRRGVIAATSAYVLWGMLPIYLRAVGFAGPFEVLAERILFSVPSAAVVILLMYGWRRGLREFAVLRNPRLLAALALSSVLIFLNWGLYVWAVANGQVIEAALAYFISPMLQVMIGMAFFGERAGPGQKAALVLAALGVVAQALALGAPPWISLALSASWVGYAVVRKRAPVPAATGLFAEALLLAPLAGAMLVWISQGPGLTIDDSASNAALLLLAGPVTVIPLLLFTIGARRISFATIGLLQFLAPSIQFVIGVFWGEPLPPLRLISFALIWAGLIAFTWDAMAARRAKPIQTEA